jgi:hypothetical protein
VIKLWILIISRILPLLIHLGIGTVEEEQKILWVWIIGIPTLFKGLGGTFEHLVLEAVVIGGPDHQLDSELVKLLCSAPVVPSG